MNKHQAPSSTPHAPRSTLHAPRSHVLQALGAWCFSGAWCLMVGASAPSHTLHLQLAPTFNSHPLSTDSLTTTTAAGQQVSSTRLDFLLSEFSLSRDDGSWLHLTNSFAFISGRAGRASFELRNLPAGRYQKLRFHVGLLPETNHKDPAGYPAGHPLNPQVNGLHWGWSGGYVFLALEGHWLRDGGQQSGYSYHLATDAQLITIELPLDLNLSSD